MTKTQEIEYLLQIVSQHEREFFERMYPNGIENIPNKDHAIFQIKNTLTRRGVGNEKLKEENKQLQYELFSLQAKYKICLSALDDANDKLKTINYKPSEMTEDDANFLLALRQAGVDNWDGYDLAVELYEQNKST